jgi:LDH2 family malate/lactate/ureidoglycolate dehydrogenase
VEAISVVAQGKIVMAQKAGQSIPPGWAIDAEGRPTQDAEVALKGAVLPMGGYKGAGLALVIDALCGVLTGVAFGSHVVDLYDESDRVQDEGIPKMSAHRLCFPWKAQADFLGAGLGLDL